MASFFFPLIYQTTGLPKIKEPTSAAEKTKSIIAEIGPRIVWEFSRRLPFITFKKIPISAM